MIGSYLFQINTEEPLPQDRAYAFYSCLLSLVPDEYATILHDQGETPISQCLYREDSRTLWRINLLDEDIRTAFSPVLDTLHTLPLHTGPSDLELLGKTLVSAEGLIQAARERKADRFFSLRFLSPTAFKQNGSYTILPNTALILQSLTNKWNRVFSSYPLDDENAFQMLCEGIRISDYSLRTTRFQLKDTKIPGFIGNLRLTAHLSAPMLELWKVLLAFSEYSGIGIKTALGMGGVNCL